MKKAEFDKFAEEYNATHSENIRFSGESPDFFAEYKIIDIAKETGGLFTGARILDFGSGIGGSIPHVNKYFPGASLTCLDVSSRSLEIAKQRFPDTASYMLFDGINVPYAENEFDLVYAACVFHHIDESMHSHFLRELNRVLRPGGWLFVFEHNPLNPLTRRAVDTCPFDENAVLISAPTMRAQLMGAKFQNVILKYRVFFPRLLSFFRPIESALSWLPVGAQYFVSGKKA